MGFSVDLPNVEGEETKCNEYNAYQEKDNICQYSRSEKLNPKEKTKRSTNITSPNNPATRVMATPRYPANRNGTSECEIKLSVASLISFQVVYEASP